MEADPSQAVVEDESRRHGFFREVLRVNAMVLKTVEVESALFEFNDGDFCFPFSFNVPVEVELPGRDRLGQLPVFIAQRDAKLDDFQLVYAVFDCNVLPLVLRASFEITF